MAVPSLAVLVAVTVAEASPGCPRPPSRRIAAAGLDVAEDVASPVSPELVADDRAGRRARLPDVAERSALTLAVAPGPPSAEAVLTVGPVAAIGSAVTDAAGAARASVSGSGRTAVAAGAARATGPIAAGAAVAVGGTRDDAGFATQTAGSTLEEADQADGDRGLAGDERQDGEVLVLDGVTTGAAGRLAAARRRPRRLCRALRPRRCRLRPRPWCCPHPRRRPRPRSRCWWRCRPGRP